MTKRISALLLCLTLLLPMTAYAETEPTVERTDPICEICGVTPCRCADETIPPSDTGGEKGEDATLPECTAPDNGETGDTVTVDGKQFSSDVELTVAQTAEENLTVTFSDAGSLTIRVTDPVYHRYLWDNNGTNADNQVMWNEGTTARSIGGVSRQTNDAIITAKEIDDCANEDPDADMVIYARPGMAIGFTRGTNWTERGDGQTWSWYWDDTTNWAVLGDVTTVTEVTFPLTAGTDGGYVQAPTPAGSVCTVKIVIIPNTPPTVYAGTTRTLPVTLYNYDGALWNAGCGGEEAVPFLAFVGASQGEQVTPYPNPANGANTGGGVAIMGILEDTLDESNLPATAGGYQQVDLFSTTERPGKTVYQNVQFPFLYDPSTGYYIYDSSQNHAQFDGGNTVTLYDRALTHGYTSGTKGGLYPFNDIREGEPMADGNYALDPVSSSSVQPASRMDMHFGLQLAADFYLPADRMTYVSQTDTKEQILFDFTGDDDLWVFIDGTLVLDVGGGHTPVSGSINVTTGEWTVSAGRELGSADAGQRSGRFDVDTVGAFQADAMHTLRIFYLERHSGESNCFMKFNLPIPPSNSVTVTKHLVNQDGDRLSVTPDVDYTFTVQTKSDASSGDFSPLADTAYTILGDSGTYRTDASGRFTLKPGQSARFTDISRFTVLQITEDEPDDGYLYRDSMAKVTVNTNTFPYTYGTGTSPVEMGLSPVSYTFTNYMQTQPLTVKKLVANGTEGLLDPAQVFSFELEFTEDCLAQTAIAVTGDVTSLPVSNKSPEGNGFHPGGAFRLGHGQSVTIPRVPVNMTYTLLEEDPDPDAGSFGTPAFRLNEESPQTVSFGALWEGTVLNAPGTVTVTNRQFFNLIIEKQGIDGMDHNTDESQSTLYQITGPDGFSMQAAICGNGTAVIRSLPVASYTVRELTGWSWRYTPSGTDSRNVKPTVCEQEVQFENTRQNPYWLSGDCYAENWWDGGQIKKRVEYPTSP